MTTEELASQIAAEIKHDAIEIMLLLSPYGPVTFNNVRENAIIEAIALAIARHAKY